MPATGPVGGTARGQRQFSVVGIVKNNADYLLEWIAFHRLVGFDHFYLADNASTDGTGAILRALEKLGLVTYTHWPVDERAQFKWYNHAVSTFAKETRFMAFLDADEFLYPGGAVQVAPHLATLLAPDDVGAVAVNWHIFGSAGHKLKQPGLVLERFTHASFPTRMVKTHVKSIVKPHLVDRMWTHTAELREGARYVDGNGDLVAFHNDDCRSGRMAAVVESPLVVNHYAVKSEQEFRENKSRKGRVNLGSSACRNMKYFKNHDLNGCSMVPSIELINGCKREARRLNAFVEQLWVSVS